MFRYDLAIVDSDTFHISMMKQNLSTYTKKYGIAFDLHVYDQAMDFLNTLPCQPISLAIISINQDLLPENTPAQPLQRLKLPIPVIFAGTEAEQAYDAYKSAASGFLLKPVLFSDLEELLNRLLPVLYVQMTLPNISNSLCVRRDGRTTYVMTKDIRYVEKYRNKLYIYTDKDCYHTYYTIKELKQLLNPKQFIQIHQGCLVNWDYVQGIEGHFIVMEHCRLLISSSHYKSVLFQQQMHPIDQRIHSYYEYVTKSAGIADTPLHYPAHDSSHMPFESSYCESTVAACTPPDKESLPHTVLPEQLQNTRKSSY